MKLNRKPYNINTRHSENLNHEHKVKPHFLRKKKNVETQPKTNVKI